MWAWSIVNFFILFINFGFGLSVTKIIAIHRKNREKVSEIISTTLLTKMLLFLVALLVFTAMVTLVPRMHEHRLLFMLMYLFAFGEMLMPIWYFQGMEEMKYTAIITSFIKIFFTVLVFLMIKEEGDYLKVPVLYAVSSLISALFAYYIIYFKDKMVFKRPVVSEVFLYVKEGTALFLSSSISVLKERLTIVFIEHFLGLSAVAFFDIAQKFVNILLTPFHILATVLYPHLAQTKNFELLKKTMFYSTGAALFLYVITYMVDPYVVVVLYGRENDIIETLIKILSFSILFANLASLLGTNGLVVAGENNKLFLSSLYGMLSFFLVLFFFVTVGIIHLNYLAFAIVFAYAADMLFRLYFMRGYLWQE
jgi:PST family polysaccharide transporter